jgi:hypothetical protein
MTKSVQKQTGRFEKLYQTLEKYEKQQQVCTDKANMFDCVIAVLRKDASSDAKVQEIVEILKRGGCNVD